MTKISDYIEVLTKHGYEVTIAGPFHKQEPLIRLTIRNLRLPKMFTPDTYQFKKHEDLVDHLKSTARQVRRFYGDSVSS